MLQADYLSSGSSNSTKLVNTARDRYITVLKAILSPSSSQTPSHQKPACPHMESSTASSCKRHLKMASKIKAEVPAV